MSETASPTSTKPYLVRAIHEWCSDNGLTPYIAVSVTERVRVPQEHVQNGEIVLNVGMLATDRLQITNDEISFQARFSGKVQQILIPMDNVVAIYAKETGNGMAFEMPKPMAETGPHLQAVDAVSVQDPSGGDGRPDSGQSPEPPAPTPASPAPGRPKLTRVK